MHEFFHDEDEVGMTQLLPVEWWDHCAREFEAMAAHAEAHRSPEGVGWTEMYQHSVPDPSLPRLCMTEERFVELLRPHARQFDRIDNTLAEVDAALGIRAIGFGPSRHVGIIADLDGDSVSSIWGRLFTQDAAARGIVAAMLTALGRDQNLLLVDWRAHRLVDLRSPSAIDAYLA